MKFDVKIVNKPTYLMEAIPVCYELSIKESVKHTMFIYYLLLN